MNKHKSHQHSQNESHYMAQFIATYRNKLARVRKSSGTKAANDYSAKYYPIALAMSTRKKQAVTMKGKKAA